MTLNEVIRSARELLELQDQIFEEEDDLCETWLMGGIPDGYTQTDLVNDLLEDYEWYYELHALAISLLIERQMRDLN